jgi:hypothetical protein
MVSGVHQYLRTVVSAARTGGFGRFLSHEWRSSAFRTGGTDTFEELREYKGITDTRERDSEHEASEFTIHGVDDEDDQDEAGPDPTQVDTDRQVKAALRAVLIQGQSYPDAAELVDFKDTWVGDRVREWRRGDHRDLLPESEVPEENRTE